MSKSYHIRQHNRKHYTNFTVQFLLQEAEQITAHAVRHGVPRHTILVRAIKAGLPEVLARLEAKAARLRAAKKED